MVITRPPLGIPATISQEEEAVRSSAKDVPSKVAVKWERPGSGLDIPSNRLTSPEGRFVGVSMTATALVPGGIKGTIDVAPKAGILAMMNRLLVTLAIIGDL